MSRNSLWPDASASLRISVSFIALMLPQAVLASVCDTPSATYVYAGKTTANGATVCNPITGNITTVSGRITDPAGTATAGDNAWVTTSDGYHFMVKQVGDPIYLVGATTTTLKVTSNTYPSTTSNIAGIENTAPVPGVSSTSTINAAMTSTQWATFTAIPTPDPATPPSAVQTSGPSGFVDIRTGQGGDNGHDGALFVSAGAGGNGHAGPDFTRSYSGNITATVNHGMLVASVGGNGGKGGDGYLGPGGASGGDGGAGGDVTFTYASGQTVTSGANHHGIFVFSKSGKGGDAGKGYAAIGGSGSGGSGADGGNVTVTTNPGTLIETRGDGSHGIYGLSVGNNGGSGGASWGVVGQGGSGGSGGDGGAVSVTNGGNIVTLGKGSHGIFSQSIGGGGGDGGTSGGIVAFSDVGAGGGSSGLASASNTGSIWTDGNYSRGIFVQSIGGGGGAGGDAGGIYALGGTGAGGGTAGVASVTNSGNIFTEGLGSDGIMVQSIAGSGGGGGGGGGLVSLGGSGSIGGDGNTVSVTNSGQIQTQKDGARGIIAQSIGGGGGDGGNSGGMVAIGGKGAGGGAGGTVNVTNTGSIFTKGKDAFGILAQSIGGGGGNGGSAGSVGVSLSVAIGGKGGKGGAGGNVVADLGAVGGTQVVSTVGANATGIMLQSVGGGGGNGGGAVSASVGVGIASSISLGGGAGDGGKGGTVSAKSTSGGALNIQTTGTDAAGLLAQSVGGGGGNGGYAISAALSGGPAAGSITTALGGSGGKGGEGGTVDVGAGNAPLKLNVTTTNDRSSGAIFQSIGGGGGNGGSSVSVAGAASLGFSGAVSLAVGGSGGDGGIGGTVNVNTQYQATTYGSSSIGLLAQSVGGGGGNGGSAISGNMAVGLGTSVTASVGLGGTGGKGGKGGDVTLNSTGGTVRTSGNDSAGIVAQSIGGGGGNGGYAVAPTGAGAGGISISASVALGGNGGGAGLGGTVTATVGNDVATSGVNSTGILAQSVGGGGGNGGMSVAPSVSGAASAAAIGFSMGGNGGIGVDGGNVTLTTNGSGSSTALNTVTTVGANATGIIAQSIGGGGGNGGMSVAASGSGGAVSAAGAGTIGGEGSDGGKGGTVTVDINSNVETSGTNASGIIVQSIGGGGGNGGLSVAGTLSGSAAASGGISLALGGGAGKGVTGGEVLGSIHANVSTQKALSNGIVVQSIGGGGGNGGTAISGAGAGSGGAAGNAAAAIGGTGGGGGTGGKVKLTSITGDRLSTRGDFSTGLLVQSVGGGGGNGGTAVSGAVSGAGAASGNLTGAVGGNSGSGNHADEVKIDTIRYGRIETLGNSSTGVIVQSIGGGGGNGGAAFSGSFSGAGVASATAGVTIGGTGGAGGMGGLATAGVFQTEISTAGANSFGLLVQSVGGGGGNGGLSIIAGGAGAGTAGGSATVALGGYAGSGSIGKKATLTGNEVTVVTSGAGSSGIVAQSIGGGGGNGGAAISGALAGAGVAGGAVSSSVGGLGGTGGNGGVVKATMTATSVGTKGANATAIVAQSIGGGGGNGGFAITASGAGGGTAAGAASVGLGGAGASGGIGGVVTASFEGEAVTTEGADSTGILAQSIGGGGGNGGFSIAASGSGAGVASGTASITIGGAGGKGSQAGNVFLTADYGLVRTGSQGSKWVRTDGANATAIVAQSIGGGGGNGGFSIGAAGSGAGTASGAISVGVGGGAGGGGFAGTVTATIGNAANNRTMQIITSGDYAGGLLMQSIGGGGGNGGFSIMAAGAGAGTAGGAATVGVGGGGGGGGYGNTVTGTVSKTDISTKGLNSFGILAQSIGGGGGNGGLAITAAGAGGGTAAAGATVSVGGGGGVGNHGGNVTLNGDAVTVQTAGAGAKGIVAQSIGGGGGNGGAAIGATVAGAGVAGGAATASVGGKGSGGGNGGVVKTAMTATSAGTSGANATAILVQSIGGGGGNGGFAIGGAGAGGGKAAGAANMSLGGSGGPGGIGGTVNANFAGDKVTTEGADSIGILAQSVGGGGGNGGFSIAAAGSGAGTVSGAATVTIGGKGGKGSEGGNVTLKADYSDVRTQGAGSTAIVAQSIGGGGGNGGFSIAAAGSGAGTAAGGASVGLGGGGGGAGFGGNVDAIIGNSAASTDMRVFTNGNQASGVLAQSIGGGGGNGGFSVTASVGGGGTVGGAVGVTIGGAGGKSNTGGVVDLTINNTSIETHGQASVGILAQSLGGGGGNGGFAVAGSGAAGGTAGGAISAAIGGKGGSGSTGGTVTAKVEGTSVKTAGANATAILAQSVGGGGGNGGMAIGGSAAGGGTGAGGITAAIGGSGGSGNSGGTVSLTSDYDYIYTTGTDASGAVAQSIGGGGGNGGMSIALSAAGAGTGAGAISFGMGGSGGSGAVGGAASLNASGLSYATEGDNSYGILAQSIGGGGGNGGLAITAMGAVGGTGAGGVALSLGGSGGTGGHGGMASLTSDVAQVWTKGDSAIGIASQSIGGGGGNGGMAISASISGGGSGAGGLAAGIGGSGGSAGNGGSATAQFAGGRVLTEGSDSIGVLTQSIGGGGGNGGMAIAVSLSGAGKFSVAAALGIGGSGASGGNGGAVSARGDLDAIATLGDNAGGIVTQSLGGGGGNGGMTVTVAGSGAGTGSLAAGVGIGGSAAGGGKGGSVDVDLHVGSISTEGNNAHGMLSQSIGGGGGNGGMSITAALNGSRNGGAIAVGIGGTGGGGGNAGTVKQNVTGTNGGTLNIATLGDDSHGALVQSVGGGGGNGGMSVTGAVSLSMANGGAAAIGIGGFGGGGGDGGTVSNTMTADVETEGAGAYGIATQSLGGGGGNGGIAIAGALSLSGKNGGAVGVGVGGFGGGGGNGAAATSKITGDVETKGDGAFGVLTQSVGGSGGNGGTAIVGAVSLAKENGGAISVGVGGFGGEGGDAGSVNSTLTGNVTTLGEGSNAVVAQSIGGGGGNGGTSVSGAVSITGKSGVAVSIGIGGFAGDGGDAGKVEVDAAGDIVTGGDGSLGILAQSVGGGGGNGGTNVSGAVAITNPTATGSKAATIAFGMGGFGGAGGNAGDVVLRYKGALTSVPLNEDGSVNEAGSATGILAQSVGGGGGNGGTNLSAGLTIASRPGAADPARSKGYAAVVGVGGFGGSGGDAGAVNATIDAGSKITAYGIDASGVLAQSVGGGGGNGGTNVSAGIVSDVSLVVGVGGFGGAGGKAGNVTVTSRSDITVLASLPEDDAEEEGEEPEPTPAEVVQERLGAAGKAVIDTLMDEDGFYDKLVEAGAAGDEDKNDADMTAGIFAQSIGGGGGNGGMNVSGGAQLSKDGKMPSVVFGVGGKGGAGNVSGNVAVDHGGTIATVGANKMGILAQSIAGGGGNGASNISGNMGWSASTGSKGTTDLAIVAGIGGFAGGGADAGAVSVVSAGGISTQGDASRGIFAQSIGGGGGTGGTNVTGVAAKDSNSLSLGIGGFAGGGGNAGTVSVSRGLATRAAGTIVTEGLGAHGLQAQSIGGGGGDGGANMVIGYAGDKNSVDEGTVQDLGMAISSELLGEEATSALDAMIATIQSSGAGGEEEPDPTDPGGSQKKAYAAQVAIGGSGGSAGNGNIVTVDHFGDILTQGENSHGIFAQSIGGGGGNAGINIAKFRQTGKRAEEAKGFSFALGGGTGAGGSGADVTVNHTGDISTLGASSYAVFAQSVGGGGGNAAMDEMSMDGDGGTLSVIIGRVGGTGGTGGNVNLAANGIITTEGDMSTAVFAQSLGNGGGNSSTTSIKLSVPGSSGEDTGGTGGTGGGAGEEPEEPKGKSVAFALGMGGGVGGRAGNVSITADGSIVTAGDLSHGIQAQSIGGGGGNAGSTEQGEQADYGLTLNIGGTGGSGGVGGNVDVTNNADILTQGPQSYGMFAQSIGGAGGTGGSIGTPPVTTNDDGEEEETEYEASESAGRTLTLNMGGAGGSGMAAGDVSARNTGLIITESDLSHGIVAQSIGGGGGTSGSITQVSVFEGAEESVSLTLSMGGKGGTGAVSGDVEVTNSGIIQTAGNRAAGIFAQAVGGGGGNADKVLTSTSTGSGTSYDASLSFGGTGGRGGAAGNVTVTNEAGGQILTAGVNAHGIFAQSVGGGGGTGGSVETYAGSAATAPAPGEIPTTPGDLVGMTASAQLSFGGTGGAGGTGGDVSITNAGLIDTAGAAAHGIFAQSVGGGGGDGGSTLNSATAFQSAGDVSLGATTLSLGFGGTGGTGNTAGDVIVANTGKIIARGEGSYGIFAQSVGGGGGNGGMAMNTGETPVGLGTDPVSSLITKLNFGGTGGAGGDAGDVTVTNTGDITVLSDNAYGILAQSVGGGGGNGGVIANELAFDAASSALENIMGGSGGNTGLAGNVTVTSTGNIAMLGENSVGILRNAVSGGGGISTTDIDLSDTLEESSEDASERSGMAVRSMSVAAMRVNAAPQRNLSTQLGARGSNGNIGSDVEATHRGDSVTLAKNSFAALTQSIGGGGGTMLTSLAGPTTRSLSIGGRLGATDSSASAGGTIASTRIGVVATRGTQSLGEVLQSIGGGGGVLSLAAPSAGTSSGDMALGANGGDGNHGGAITVKVRGATGIVADLAPAVTLQSIGGGGGSAVLSGMRSVHATLGGVNGAVGNGDDISLTDDGDIATEGRFAHGVVMQSIGGGGGFVLTDADTVNVGSSSANRGDGGDLDLSLTGDVLASGNGASAVVLQSLGGGGGFVNDRFLGTAGGAGMGGNIDVSIDGNVRATGANGIAVMLQSDGRRSADAGNISASFTGLMQGGTGDASKVAAVVLSGGKTNQLTFGRNSFIFAANRQALLGSYGEDNATLSGALVGNIDFGTGINSLTVTESGYVRSMDRILLGFDGVMENSGILDPGGDFVATKAAAPYKLANYVVQTTKLTGSLIMTDTSRYIVDARFLVSGAAGGANSDLVTVSNAGTMGGEVIPVLLDLQRALPLTIIDPVTSSANTGTKVKDTIFLDYEVTLDGATGDGTTIDLSVTPNFSISGMTKNQSAVGGHFNDILNGQGSAGLGKLFALLGNATDRSVAINLMDQLHGEGYAADGVVGYNAGRNFRMLPAEQRKTAGGYTCDEFGDCVWMHIDRTELSNRATFDTRAIDSDFNTWAMGFDREVDNGWRIGVAGGRQHGSLVSGSQFSSSFHSNNAMIYGFNTLNGWDVSGVLHYGRASYDTMRHVGITGTLPDGTPVSYGSGENRHKLSQLGLSADISRKFPLDQNGIYLRPSTGIDIVRFRSKGGSEDGLDEVGLRINRSNQTFVTGKIGVELGIDRPLGEHGSINAYVGVAHYFRNRDQFTTSTSFNGADPLDGGFTNYAELGNADNVLSAGISLVDKKNGMFFDLNYMYGKHDGRSMNHAGISAGFRF